MDRAAELDTALTRLRARIDAACVAAQRDPAEVTLLPVTKFFPASDVEILIGLGCCEFGESRDQEAAAKAADIGDAAIRWHMIGKLQRNKARHVARWASVVHSVDSVRLAEALERGAAAESAEGGRSDQLGILVQVSLDDDPARGGASAGQLPALAESVAAATHLELLGCMAIPPVNADPERAYAQLAQLRTELLRDHPTAQVLSAGMSNDLEYAVEYGSTCVRVGTALLGVRPIISP